MPTGGSAKTFSGLTIDQFYRRTSVVEYPERSLFRVKKHIEALCEVGTELARVLKPTGSWWLNLGDSYSLNQAYALMGNGDGTFQGAPQAIDSGTYTGNNLGDVNGAVREIQASVDDLYDVDAPHDAEVHASIDRSWKAIDLALVRYRELPAFKGEAELFADIPAALRDFDVAVQTTIAEAESGAVDKARVDSDVLIRPRANRITHLIREVVRLNATNAVAAATRIDATRHATVALSALLNVIAVLLTFGAARWVVRLVRAHDELLAARLAFEEHRTAELEVFAQRVAHDLLSPLSSLSFCLAAFKKPSAEDPKLGHAL